MTDLNPDPNNTTNCLNCGKLMTGEQIGKPLEGGVNSDKELALIMVCLHCGRKHDVESTKKDVVVFPFCIKIEEVGRYDNMKLAMKMYNYFLSEKIHFNCIYSGKDSMMIMLYRQVEYDKVIAEFDLKKLEVFFDDRKRQTSSE